MCRRRRRRHGVTRWTFYSRVVCPLLSSLCGPLSENFNLNRAWMALLIIHGRLARPPARKTQTYNFFETFETHWVRMARRERQRERTREKERERVVCLMVIFNPRASERVTLRLCVSPLMLVGIVVAGIFYYRCQTFSVTACAGDQRCYQVPSTSGIFLLWFSSVLSYSFFRRAQERERRERGSGTRWFFSS